MAVWSEVSLGKLAHGFRIDGEFYKEKYLMNDTFLNRYNCMKLGHLGRVTDGEHGSVDFTKDGIKYLMAENIKNGYVDIEKIRYVSKNVDDRNARARVEVNDILVSIKGTLGQIGIAEKWLKPANMNRDVAIVKSRNATKIDNHFAALFLQTKFGIKQLEREGSGAVQQMITLGRLREIKIPLIGREIQKKVSDLYQKSLRLLQESKSKYDTALRFLEQELGLNKLNFKKPIGYEANFNDLILANRLDAQHYRSKYDILFDKIKRKQWEHLRDLCLYNRRGQQPVYVENGSIDVINSQHIGKQHLDYKNFQKTTLEFFKSNPQAHVKPNDLLIYTTGAYIGNTNVYLSEKPALASNHVNILRLKENVDAAYLAVILQSIVGQFQTEKYSRGSAQAELYPYDISKFIVPILPEKQQKEIGDLSRESLRLNQHSFELLEKAKQMVENLIEQAAGET